MKKVAKWVALCVALVFVIGMCGVRQQLHDEYDVFKEATQSMKQRDWQRFVKLVADPTSQNAPTVAAQAKFFEKYVADQPETTSGGVTTLMSQSNLVPIPNYDSTLLLPGPPKLRLTSVHYQDKVAYWSIPFLAKRFSIFKGKRVFYNFSQTFIAVARMRDHTPAKTRSHQALARFAREEGQALKTIGIEPKNLFHEGSWKQFATLMDERAERSERRAQAGLTAPSAKDSRRVERIR